jgi:predicted AAA+ superfamily ATPase
MKRAIKKSKYKISNILKQDMRKKQTLEDWNKELQFHYQSTGKPDMTYRAKKQ